MTSCQVSLKWKIGPSTAQAITMSKAPPKAVGWPSILDIHLAKREKTMCGSTLSPFQAAFQHNGMRYFLQVTRCTGRERVSTPSESDRPDAESVAAPSHGAA